MLGTTSVNPNSRKREQWEMATESGHALLKKTVANDIILSIDAEPPFGQQQRDGKKNQEEAHLDAASSVKSEEFPRGFPAALLAQRLSSLLTPGNCPRLTLSMSSSPPSS